MIIGAEELRKMFVSGSIELSENRTKVDQLNVFPVPDGDTGTNMSLTLNQAMDNINQLVKLNTHDLVIAMSKGCLMGARGNSGVILSQIFRGFAASISSKQTITTRDFAEALVACKSTTYKAVLKPVEGTMLTVIREMSEAALALSEEHEDFTSFMRALLQVGEKSLENTPNMLKPLKDAGVVDSGGMGLLFIFSGFYKALSGESYDLSHFTKNFSVTEKNAKVEDAEITYSYCTEVIVRGENLDNCNFRAFVMSMGDSVVYVVDNDLLKVHVHTNDPGRVLSESLKYGEIVKTKIENMREQHSEMIEGSHSNLGDFGHDHHHHHHKNDAKHESGAHEEDEGDASRYGFVAVAAGSGIVEILRSLGVNKIIEGGQTMNPSTKDIHSAIEAVKAEVVFVFPNNSNILMAANQAKDLSEKEVYVLPTKTIPQSIACMLAFNEMAEPEENAEHFKDLLQNVKTLSITNAIRDTLYDEIEIKNGDFIAILDSKIVESRPEIKEAALAGVAKMVDEDSEILSIYYGEGVTEDKAAGLQAEIEELYPELEVEVHYGNQPVYFYMISVE